MSEPTVLAFLIADVRGYTRFTREHGDAAAARLAQRFADLARDAVEARAGRLVELRGDEAMAVFVSPRQAIRAAAELIAACTEEAAADATLPLFIGAGIAAGEAVPVEGGFRGMALNTAARLCSQAAGGEVLVPAALVREIGEVQGIDFTPHGVAELKGFEAPVELVQAIAEVGAATPVGGGPAAESLPAELVRDSPVAGRQSELAWLRGTWRQVRRGRGRLVFVSGPAGSGKTLTAAASAEFIAAADGRVVYAGAGGAAAAVASSTLEDALSSGMPTLVVLDDLDAVADGVVTQLHQLRNAIEAGPTLVLALVRDSDALPELARLVEAVDADGDSHRHLAPLDLDAVREIAAAYAGDDVDDVPLESIVRGSRGLPGLVHELLAAWAEEEATRRMAAAAEWLSAERDEYRSGLAFANNVIGLKLARLYHVRTAVADGATAACPYKGLAPFEEADAALFFGRERLVGELAARTVGAGLMGVVGSSGSGKSSVIAAGLVPSLRAGLLPGSERWQSVTMRPGERPLDELDAVTAGVEGDGRLVLVVDQLEEMFTLCEEEEQRESFVARLVSLAAEPEQHAVVLGLRGDFYGHCAAYPELAELLAQNHVLVGPMTPDELRRAVELPARRVGVRAESALVTRLVEEVSDEPGALPLLSTALVELWGARSDGWLRIADHESLGGVHGAVARLAEGSFAHFSPPQQAAARLLFLRLAVTGEDGGVTRRRVHLTELDLGQDQVMASVVRRLVEDRLLTADEQTVEVAHEALLREWPRLQDWLTEDAQGRELREHLVQSARRWDASGRDAAELYRGARLSATLDWAGGRGHELNELEREFVSEGRAESERELVRQRRQNRRLRGLLGAAALLLLVAFAAGGFALLSRSDAQASATAATAQRLGAQALTVDEVDLSLLLARQGVAVHDSREAMGNLESALVRAPEAIRFMRPLPGRLLVAAVSPDGKYVVYESNAGQVAITDPSKGRVLRTVAADGWDFAPDGHDLLVGRGFPEIEHFRVSPETGKERLVVKGTVPEDAADFTFAPGDPGTLIMVDRAGTITVRDFVSGKVKATLASAPAGVTRFYGQDQAGRYVVIGSRSPETESRGVYEIWSLSPLRRDHVVEDPRGGIKVRLAPNRRLLAVAHSEGGTIAIHDLRTGRSRLLAGRHRDGVQDLVFSQDSSLLASTDTAEGQTLVWDVKTGELRHELGGHSARPNLPAFSRDKTTLYTVGHDGAAITWDLAGARRLARPFHAGEGNRPTAASPEPFPTFAMSPDGTRIAVTEGRGRLAVVALDRFRTLFRTAPVGGRMHDVAWSPDGKELATAAAGAPVAIWRASDGRRLRTISGAIKDALTIGYSPDGELLAAGLSDGTIHMWRSASGEPQGKPLSAGPPGGLNRPLDLAFSRDGRKLAAAFASLGTGGGAAVVWSVADGTELYRVENVDDGYGRGSAVAFSPNGRLLATGGGTGEIKLWDAETGKQDGASLTGVAGWVTGMQFDPTGRLLAATGDGAIRIWDVERRAPFGSPVPGFASVSDLRFTPNGSAIVEVYDTGEGLIWPMSPDVWKERACAVAGRMLSEREWQLYLRGRSYAPSCAATASTAPAR